MTIAKVLVLLLRCALGALIVATLAVAFKWSLLVSVLGTMVLTAVSAFLPGFVAKVGMAETMRLALFAAGLVAMAAPTAVFFTMGPAAGAALAFVIAYVTINIMAVGIETSVGASRPAVQ